MKIFTHDVMVAGHTCIDLIPTIPGSDPESVRKTLGPGKTLQIGELSVLPGGAVPNVGIVLEKLGIPVIMTGLIGDDFLGRLLLEEIRRLAPSSRLTFTTRPETHTSYSIIISPPVEDRWIMQHPGANDLFLLRDIEDKLFNEARLLHFGYPQVMRSMFIDEGRNLEAILAKAKKHDMTTSLDTTMADPDSEAGRTDWKPFLRRVLPYVDIFLPSLDEILIMLNEGKEEEIPVLHNHNTKASNFLTRICDECLGYGSKIVGIKLGDKGFFLRSSSHSSISRMGLARPRDTSVWADVCLWQPCYKVKVLSTIGAGDSTIAGFLAGLLKGLTPSETLKMAAAAGAVSVETGHRFEKMSSSLLFNASLEKGWPTV